jgi:putative ABC transport system substrate-binding protein
MGDGMKLAGLAAALLLLLAVALGAEAQPGGKSPRVGFLSTFSPSDVPRWREGLTKGLRDLGYTEGYDIVIEYRHAEGRPERLPDLAAELVRLKVDVIVAETTPASLAAKKATTTIPIVMTIVGNPVEAGLIASLGRPGGNITGLSLQLSDVTAKRLQVLREVVPGLSRVAILWNSASPVTPPQLREVEAAARYWRSHLNPWRFKLPMISRRPSRRQSEGARELFSFWTTFSSPDTYGRLELLRPRIGCPRWPH